MIDPTHVPPIGADELLARYIFQKSHIRASDRTVKPDAFIPNPHSDLSVTRHVMASEAEIWNVGLDVANLRGKILYGRGDVSAGECAKLKLTVQPAPLANNPNHATVAGWPDDKPLQKIIAQQIAAVASFVAAPGPGGSSNMGEES